MAVIEPLQPGESPELEEFFRARDERMGIITCYRWNSAPAITLDRDPEELAERHLDATQWHIGKDTD